MTWSFFSFSKNGYMRLEKNNDILQIIPKQVFEYFPIAPGIREDEFEYISSKILTKYGKYIKDECDKNKFMILLSEGITFDLASTSADTVEKVKRMKRRNEMDSFIKKIPI